MDGVKQKQAPTSPREPSKALYISEILAKEEPSPEEIWKCAYCNIYRNISHTALPRNITNPANASDSVKHLATHLALRLLSRDKAGEPITHHMILKTLGMPLASGKIIRNWIDMWPEIRERYNIADDSDDREYFLLAQAADKIRREGKSVTLASLADLTKRGNETSTQAKNRVYNFLKQHPDLSITLSKGGGRKKK